ncbi:MAG TPA: hypothetical protein VFO54_10960 [Chryseosolibacter sp.]|nr:hypothetical protein [Chryseosolibacter sp.]
MMNIILKQDNHHYTASGACLFFSRTKTIKAMISVVGTTGDHALQPALEEKHKETTKWISSIKLWQKELAFFQTLLDGTVQYFTTADDKKKVSRFQNLFMYYHVEVLPELRVKLRVNERHLGNALTDMNVSDSAYYEEHKSIMSELEQFSKTFAELRNDFFKFIEKIK